MLRLGETLIAEAPPRYGADGPIGQQVRGPSTGDRAERILHGAIDVRSGAVALRSTEAWTNETHRALLRMVRDRRPGWGPVLFEDRATQHRSPGGPAVAAGSGIAVRLLPRAAPERSAMDHLWRHTKREALGDRETVPIERSARAACRYILDLSPEERLRKAGVLSGNFWLTK